MSGDLTYASVARCRCGAGLAYPKDIGVAGKWSCSAVLRGESPASDAHEEFSFVFYEIKSENQPSQCGATTRPA